MIIALYAQCHRLKQSRTDRTSLDDRSKPWSSWEEPGSLLLDSLGARGKTQSACWVKQPGSLLLDSLGARGKTQSAWVEQPGSLLLDSLGARGKTQSAWVEQPGSLLLDSLGARGKTQSTWVDSFGGHLNRAALVDTTAGQLMDTTPGGQRTQVSQLVARQLGSSRETIKQQKTCVGYIVREFIKSGHSSAGRLTIFVQEHVLRSTPSQHSKRVEISMERRKKETDKKRKRKDKVIGGGNWKKNKRERLRLTESSENRFLPTSPLSGLVLPFVSRLWSGWTFRVLKTRLTAHERARMLTRRCGTVVGSCTPLLRTKRLVHSQDLTAVVQDTRQRYTAHERGAATACVSGGTYPRKKVVVVVVVVLDVRHSGTAGRWLRAQCRE
jgi:hypothetical protein